MNTVDITLGVVSIISLLIALPQIFGSNWKDLYALIFEGKVSWSDIQKASNKVIKELRKENFSPTCILGIGRGGALATGLLSSEFNKHIIIEDSNKEQRSTTGNLKIGVINSKVYLKKDKTHNDLDNEIISRVDKIEYSNIDIKLSLSEKILVMTAQSYRGESFQKIIEKLVCLGIKRENIRTATLFWHTHKQISVLHEPDIYGIKISINKTMPWKDSKYNTDRY
jgi:hypoxanthine phosphoribosyltransferase